MKNRISNMIILLLGCVAFSQLAEAGSTSNVNVVNTPNVNVANTPTVNVGNTPSVSVSNTPNVNVANMPTVQDINNPALQPFQAIASGVFSDGGFSTTVTVTTVPAGKRLVIEHASAFGGMIVGQRMVRAEINTTLQNINNGNPVGHSLTISALGTDFSATKDNFVASQGVRLYADPGTDVTGYVERDSTSQSNLTAVTFSISGYFVNVQ